MNALNIWRLSFFACYKLIEGLEPKIVQLALKSAFVSDFSQNSPFSIQYPQLGLIKFFDVFLRKFSKSYCTNNINCNKFRILIVWETVFKLRC